MQSPIHAGPATLALFASLVAVPVAAQDPADAAAAAPSARKLADGFGFVEGPAWDTARGVLLFSDIRNDAIMQRGADGKVSAWRQPSGRTNGLVFDLKGNLYACRGAGEGGGRDVVRIAPDGTVEVLASAFAGKPLNSPNDLALDSAGGVYFTDPRYGSEDGVEQEVMGVYYISAAGEVTRVSDEYTRPNGILVSTDGMVLLVAEPSERAIYAHAIEAPGKISPRQPWFFGDEELDKRGPDGMACDEHGRVYATYHGIVVLERDATVQRRIAVAERPTNCQFGRGDAAETLFITARTGLYAFDVGVAGAPLEPGATAPAVGLDALAWMAGTWVTANDQGASSEETWTTAAGDMMLGVHRDVRPGRPTQFEYLRIQSRVRDGKVEVAYFASPGGQGETRFDATELNAVQRRAVFENPDHDFPKKITYWIDGEGRLCARAEADGRGPTWRWTRR